MRPFQIVAVVAACVALSVGLMAAPVLPGNPFIAPPPAAEKVDAIQKILAQRHPEDVRLMRETERLRASAVSSGKSGPANASHWQQVRAAEEAHAAHSRATRALCPQFAVREFQAGMVGYVNRTGPTGDNPVWAEVVSITGSHDVLLRIEGTYVWLRDFPTGRVRGKALTPYHLTDRVIHVIERLDVPDTSGGTVAVWVVRQLEDLRR
jgi:hypothetical protein